MLAMFILVALLFESVWLVSMGSDSILGVFTSLYFRPVSMSDVAFSLSLIHI